MRLMLQLIALVFFIAALGLVTQFLRLHDLGQRPVAAVQLDTDRDIRFIHTNSLRFGYLEQGTGPLVLLLHGYPETAHSWKGVQSRLAAKGFRAIAVFMRGYAPTSLAADYSVRSMGKDVVALIEAFGEESAVVAGHDWGAFAAYEAAFVKPKAISHLIALSIPHPRGAQPSLSLFLRAPHFIYYQFPTAERLLWSNEYSHIRRIFKTWSPDFDMPETEFEDIRKTLEMPGVTSAALGYYRSLAANGEDNAELTASGVIQVPTLVIAGDRDGAISLKAFGQAESAFSGPYLLKVMSGVGHFPQVEQPIEVADSIAEFLSSS